MASFFTSMFSFLRKRPKTSIAVALALVVTGVGIYLLSRPAAPEYLTEASKRADVVQTVEAVGEIISERDLKLQFPMTGIVEKVSVKEGDKVKAGQLLAKLRSNGSAGDVQSARASVQAAQADLQALEEGTRPEELLIAEAGVENKRAALRTSQQALVTAEETLKRSKESLEALEREAKTSLSGYVTTSQSIISQHINTALSAVGSVGDALNGTAFQDAATKHEPGQLKLLRDKQNSVMRHLQARPVLTFSDYRDALAALKDARDYVSEAADFVNSAYSLASTLPITSVYSNTEKEAVKSGMAADRASAQTALSAIDSAWKTLQDAASALDTRIANEQGQLTSAQGSKDRALSDIQSYQTALRIEEAQLALKRAGPRKTDLDSARARLNQAYASLQRAGEAYQNTIITAPINGVITKVNLKAGELLSTSFASDTAITMLGDSPYRVEMFISEVDVPKVQLSQTGSITLDAFPGEEFVLRVSEVEPTATQVDGVPKYRVKMDFVTQDLRLKIGMTGDTKIITAERQDVVTVPGRSILTDVAGREYVRILNKENVMEERTVVSGIDGSLGEREVLSGLEEGETVVVLVK